MKLHLVSDVLEMDVDLPFLIWKSQVDKSIPETQDVLANGENWLKKSIKHVTTPALVSFGNGDRIDISASSHCQDPKLTSITSIHCHINPVPPVVFELVVTVFFSIHGDAALCFWKV